MHILKALAVGTALAIALIPTPVGSVTPVTSATSTPEVAEPPAPTPAEIMDAKQEAWIDVLQKCESGEDETAINAVDVDGTPSYYAFQFKPGTFRGYGEQYGIIPKGLTRPELMEELKKTHLQRAIVKRMISDPYVNWLQQFPACVRKHGFPPGRATL